MNKLSLLVAALLSTSVLSVSAVWENTKKADAEKVVKETGAKYDTAKGNLGQIKDVENAKKALKNAEKSVVTAQAKLAEAKEIGDVKGIEKAEKRLENAKKSVVKHKARLHEKQTIERSL